jgi:hypothetical protein
MKKTNITVIMNMIQEGVADTVGILEDFPYDLTKSSKESEQFKMSVKALNLTCELNNTLRKLTYSIREDFASTAEEAGP